MHDPSYLNDCFNERFLDDSYLLDLYEKEVKKIMESGWAFHEIQDGADPGEIENILWNDYKSWALEYLEKEKSYREDI